MSIVNETVPVSRCKHSEEVGRGLSGLKCVISLTESKRPLLGTCSRATRKSVRWTECGTHIYMVFSASAALVALPPPRRAQRSLRRAYRCHRITQPRKKYSQWIRRTWTPVALRRVRSSLLGLSPTLRRNIHSTTFMMARLNSRYDFYSERPICT